MNQNRVWNFNKEEKSRLCPSRQDKVMTSITFNCTGIFNLCIFSTSIGFNLNLHNLKQIKHLIWTNRKWNKHHHAQVSQLVQSISSNLRKSKNWKQNSEQELPQNFICDVLSGVKDGAGATEDRDRGCWLWANTGDGLW